MKHKFDKKKSALIIQMPRELDHHSSGQLKMETDALLLQYPVRCIIFDFSDTTFMDSSGIGVILGRCKNLHFSGGEIKAIHLNPRIQKIFQVSGLFRIIEVEV